MGVRVRRPPRPNSEINVTPLVDVVLVLLIIFMVLTPLMEKELPVRVPQVNDKAVPKAEPNQSLVTAKADGTILFNGEPLAEEELKRRIDAYVQGRGDRVVFFDAEDATSYARAVQVLDLVRDAGARTIGFLTERPEGI